MKADKAFIAKKGHGKYPVMETDDGKILFESVAIAGYLLKLGKKQAMLGNNAFEEAQIN